MAMGLVFETHATSEDNERGVATGWLPGRLSEVGRQQARELGGRRRGDNLAAVFCSDLARAVETAAIAFGDTDIPVLCDWRLRECNYGLRNGTPASQLRRREHLDVPYPEGESWRHAVERVDWFLDDLARRWADRRVLLIGHTATRWALDHLLDGIPLERLVEGDFTWRPGWEYRLDRAGR
ncbi:MAG: histidine phosphatase family protein [Acidothermales bacterium]|nr:histidine phosphatase family protein [Acidothermales bacterium]